MVNAALPDFGESLRRYRVAIGLTQEQLAERAGLSARGISDLERGVNRTPRRDTLGLLMDALQLSADERATLVASVRRRGPPSSRAGPYPIPAPLTPLLGRERDIAAACALLRHADVRMVALIGPGGVGKTRLATEVANELRDDFPDGVAFVALAQIRDPRLVMSTIARTVGVRAADDRSLTDRLHAFLHDKRLLLVLDNFEQVRSAAPAVGNVLSACPALKTLVTSRAVLHLSGEHDLRVAPLALPELTETPSPEDVARSAAVCLFAARAKAARSDFVLTPGNAATVGAICTRLDGLPLALELAAARLGHMSAGALLARLDQRLPLLTGGACDHPPRLRSMRDGIAWSYDLLRADEQALFRRAAVFAGGFSLEASAAVERHATGSVDDAVLNGLASLVDASLLVRSASDADDPRFEMLETIREFALEQLVSNQEEAARDAHAAFFLALAERAAPELTGHQQVDWLDRLETELGNFRAAMEWLLLRNDAEGLLRLAGALARFWDYHSHVSEGRRWLETALAHPGAAALPVSLRGKAFQAAGVLARTQGDHQQAKAFLGQALELFRQEDDARGMAFSLNSLGTVALYVGELRHAHALHAEGLALMRTVGDPDGIAALLANLGYGALLRGECTRAIAHCEESLALYRGLGSKLGSANVLGILGRAVLEQGDHGRAIPLLREGLALNREVGNKWYTVECLEGLAGAAAAGQPERSVRLLAAAAALCDRIGVGLPSFDRTTNERYLAQSRALLDEATFAAAWNAGRAMPLEEVIDEALRDDA
jgi:predicted ATPase/transcriptional regulator with XRE-family HTH domain